MKEVRVRFDDEFYQDLEQLSRRLNTSIQGLIPYALDKAFYEELDEVFCLRGFKVAQLVAPRSVTDDNGLSWQDYRRRHDLRQRLIQVFVENLDYPQSVEGIDALQELVDEHP